jgi:hypothetical protein
MFCSDLLRQSGKSTRQVLSGMSCTRAFCRVEYNICDGGSELYTGHSLIPLTLSKLALSSNLAPNRIYPRNIPSPPKITLQSAENAPFGRPNAVGRKDAEHLPKKADLFHIAISAKFDKMNA